MATNQQLRKAGKEFDLRLKTLALSGTQGPQGPAGADGADGQDGAQGPAGPGVAAGGTAGQVLAKIDAANYNTEWVTPSTGGNATGQWRFDTSTTMADPGTGDVRLDTASFATVTQMALSQTSNAGSDAQNVLGVLKAGDIFYIQDQDDATKWARYDIDAAGTDNGTWWLFSLTYVNGGAGGLPANNQVCAVTVYLQGAAAGGGADVPLMHWVV